MNKLTLKRERFQSGTLKIEKRNTGIDVWIYRWREYRHDGTSTYKKKIVGSVSELRTKSAPQKAIEGLKLDINATVSAVPVSHTIGELIAHYKEAELESGRPTARVQQVYRHNLDDIILPEWKSYRLQDVRPIAIERWLEKLPYAPATKTKVKGVFGTLFRHGMRYQWAATNPIALVRCSSKRVDAPDILTPVEIRGILGELSEPARTVTMLAAITGLRRGELFGLRWEDLDFERRTIRIVRSLADQIEGKPKTEASRKPCRCLATSRQPLQAGVSIRTTRSPQTGCSQVRCRSENSHTGQICFYVGISSRQQSGWASRSVSAGTPSGVPLHPF